MGSGRPVRHPVRGSRLLVWAVSVTGFELFRVEGENITADLLVWRRYRMPAPGILEKMLDANPQIAHAHRTSVFLPVGLLVRIPIDPAILAGQPQPIETGNLWTDKRGYQL